MKMSKLDNLNPFILAMWEINTKFQERCYMDWSDENLLTIVTPDGIYVLTPQLEVHHGPFSVDFIENPKSRFTHPSLRPAIPYFDKLWQTLDNQQYMEVFLNPALATNIEKLPTNIHRKFRIAKWSPVIELYPAQCLLTTITVDHQLSVYYRLNRVWITCANLSDDYDRLLAKLNESQFRGMRSFEDISHCILALSFCMLCWKIRKDGISMLLAATISGDIVVWRLNINPLSQSKRKHILIPETILKTGLEYINSMDMFDDLLIVSTRFGQVVLYNLSIYLNPKVAHSLEDTDEIDISQIVVEEIPVTVNLWHRDNIEVMDFYLQPFEEGTCRLVLAKATNICWSIVQYKKEDPNMPATLAVSDSFSAIDGLDPDVTLHQTAANWLKKAGDKRAVLTADDGSFFQLEFADGHAQAIPEFSVIRTGKVDLTDMVPRGLATSPRGHLVAMVSCVTFMYDAAKLSAPSRLLLVPIVNDKKFLSDCLSKLFDDNWLRENNIKSPMDVCDRIDYIRSIFPQLNYEQLHCFSQTLQTLARDIDYPKDDYQLVRLKILRFIWVKLNEFNESDSAEVRELSEKLFSYIFARYIESTLDYIFDAEQTGKSLEELNRDQVNSLRNYRIWLQESNLGANILHRYEKQLNNFESKYSHIGGEICSICQNEVGYRIINHGACSNQHRIARCARSLLLLEGFLVDEMICIHCKRHFRPQLVWPSKSLWLCCVCQ